MTTSEATIAHESHDDADAHAHASHPSDKQYVLIALVLAAITALEVLTYFESIFEGTPIEWLFEGAPLAIVLLVMMAVKFYLIAAYFMHLKFDKKILAAALITGLVFAIGVYLVMFNAFRYFGGGTIG